MLQRLTRFDAEREEGAKESASLRLLKRLSETSREEFNFNRYTNMHITTFGVITCMSVSHKRPTHAPLGKKENFVGNFALFM